MVVEHRYRVDTQHVEVLPASNKAVECGVLRQFNRAIGVDFALSRYLSVLHNQDIDFNPKYKDAVDLTMNVIRHSVLGAYQDVLRYGTPTMVKHAQGVLELQQKYLKGEIEDITFGQDGNIGIAEVDGLVRRFME